MSPWPFVLGAYAVAVGLTTALLAFSYGSMRRAEAAAEALKRPNLNPSSEGEGLET